MQVVSTKSAWNFSVFCLLKFYFKVKVKKCITNMHYDA